MKALGCYVHDIRRLFLLEAGMIGFSGGIIGIVISYVISFVINLVTGGINAGYDMTTETVTKLSIIPWWLAVFAVLFSTLIGLIAGYYPAKKAVRIPAVEAMK